MTGERCFQALFFIILLGATKGFCADMNNLSFFVSDPITVGSHCYTIWPWAETMIYSPAPPRRFLKIYKNGRDLKLKGCSWPQGFTANGDCMLEYEIGKDLRILGPFIEKCASKGEES